jgi:hypothetical protein
MRPQSLIILAPLLALAAKAQTLSDGRLIVYTPTVMLSCEAANIAWVWTGDTSDLYINTIQVAVEQESENSRRSLAEASPIRFIRKRSQKLHSRDNIAINIAGGSDVPMSQGSWTWNSVGVPAGTYRMALSIEGEGYTGYSPTFTVQQGDDTSCLGGIGQSSNNVPTTTVTAQQTSTAPGQVITTDVPNTTSQHGGTASVVKPSATTPIATAPTYNAQSESGNDDNSSKKGTSGGAIAAAVIVPLLVGSVLFYLFCMRRRKAGGQSTSPDWSEKITGLLGGVGNRGNSEHRRQISTPLDPVHAAGLAKHESAVMREMRPVNDDPNSVTRAPEHWVDFHPDVQESDAHLVSPQRVEEMVRASMEMSNQQRPFYQQGSNEALRQSTSTSAQRSTMTTESDGNSTLPSYLRDADFTSYHTHSSFGHDVNGVPVGHSDDTPTLKRSSTQRTHTLERSESKIRRKPVPTYSTVGVEQAITSSSPALSDDASPFSDVHQVDTPSEIIAKAHQSSSTTVSSAIIQDDRLHEILQADQEIMVDSPTLAPSPALLHTPASMSEEFPVSVSGSPAPRVLLDTPRGSLIEEEQKEAYKLSVQMPVDDRGFRVSF